METLSRITISLVFMFLALSLLTGCDDRMDYIEQLTQPSNKVKAAQALAQYDDPETVKALLLALNDSDRKLRYAALNSLKEIIKRNKGKDPSSIAIPPLSKIVMYDPDYKVRYAALEVLGVSQAPEVDDILGDVLNSGRSPRILRLEAVKLLGERKGKKAEFYAIRALQEDQDTDVKKVAVWALGEMGVSDDAISALAVIITDPHYPDLRVLAQDAVDKIKARQKERVGK